MSRYNTVKSKLIYQFNIKFTKGEMNQVRADCKKPIRV